MDSPTVDGDGPDVPTIEIEDDEDVMAENGDSLFVGEETAEDSGSGSGDSGGDPAGEAAGLGSSDLEQAIVDGAARLAVVGLEEDEKEGLEEEFAGVFSTFRLGDYGAQCVTRYVLAGDGEVHPVMGLAGTSFACLAFALYMRPDSDEQLERLQNAVDGIGGQA